MMILGKQFRKEKDILDHHPGLGIVDYIGEPHCSQRNRVEYLQQYLDHFDVDTAIGVDEYTILEIIDGEIGETWGEGESFVVRRK